MTGAHQRFDRRLKVLHIRRFALVQNDKVDGKLLHPPIFVSLQDLAGDMESFDLGDSQQHDRKIAGDALRPQTGLRTGALPNDIRRGAQIGASEDDVACEALKKSGFAGIDPKMMELHLRLGPRQSRCALKCRRIPMFVHTIQQRRARLCRHGPECDANRRPGRHANTPAQREDWIKYGSDRIGQRPCVHDRDWRANALSAAQEARPVGFELRPADRFSIGDAQMRRPKFGFRRSPLSPRRKDRAEVLEVFGLDEQLCEGRMGDICALWPQSKFGVGCDLDVARPASRIGDGHAPNLGVVLSRNKHLKRCRQSPVASGDLDTILVEIDGIFVRLDARRLKACRPDGAALRVPKKDIRAAIVSRGVFAPSRDSDIAPPAVSGAGRSHHYGVASIGKKLCRRRGLMNGNDPAPARGIRVAGARAGLDLRRPRPRRRDLARNPLLQQQFCRLNDRLGMEALTHRAVEDRVGDPGDRHALMMRHEGADESEALAFRNPRRGEIYGLIESIPAPSAQSSPVV